jgi:hypothetical protein
VTDARNSAGGSLELPLVLRAGEVLLLDCGYRRAPPAFDIMLSSPRLLWKGGETPELLVNVRNISTKLQPLAIALTGSLPGLVPASLAKTKAETLSPGQTQVMRYRLLAPSVMETVDAFVNVRVGADSQASLALRIAASLTAELVTPRLDLNAPGGVTAARVRVVNQGKTPQMVTLRAPARSAIARSLVAGGKSVDMEVMVEAPERDAGLYAVPITVEGENGPLTTLPVRVGVPVLCPYAKARPEIDADLREWTDAVPIGLGREEQVRLKTWGGPNDLSALFYTAWDEQALYIACSVRDETPGLAYPAAELWRGDSLQFALSANRRAVNGQAGYGPGDHEFGIALVEEKPLLFRFFGAEGRTGILSEASVAVKRFGPVWFYEAAIPWKELAPLRAEAGTVFGLSVLVNDDDGRGRGYIEWGGGIGDAKRPDRFPALRLVR